MESCLRGNSDRQFNFVRQIFQRSREARPAMPEERVGLVQRNIRRTILFGATNDQLIVPDEGRWINRGLDTVGTERRCYAFVVPGIDTSGWTNLNTGASGAFRFWLVPYWTSTSVSNGTPPGRGQCLA